MFGMKNGNKTHEDRLKFLVIIVLITFSLFLTYYFHYILKTDVVFSHFFYVPIILACIWWKKKGLIISVFLAAILIFFPYSTELDIGTLENLLRALMFIVISIVVTILSEYLSRTEKSLKKSEEKYCNALERAEFYKDLFAHDISNILQIFKSSLGLFSMWLDEPEEKDKIDGVMKIMNDSIIRGTKLVTNIRTLSQASDTGELLETLDIIQILKSAIKSIYKTFPDKNLNVEFESQVKEIFVQANPFLQEVFENLLFNAVRYNKNLQIRLLVKLTKLVKNRIDYIKIEFIDNGIGVPDVMKEQIFKGISNRKAKVHGMGLGLLLVKKIINNFNGEIRVEDRIRGDSSKGSNFIILIPEAL